MNLRKEPSPPQLPTNTQPAVGWPLAMKRTDQGQASTALVLFTETVTYEIRGRAELPLQSGPTPLCEHWVRGRRQYGGMTLTSHFRAEKFRDPGGAAE